MRCAITAKRVIAQLRESQLETHLVEAQLQALQRQLQPHFLFNTLNTISALMHRDVDAADNMIAKLSDLLRISLQNVGVQEVTAEAGARFPLQVSGDRTNPLPGSSDRSVRRASGHARCAGAQPYAPAARRKLHQARDWSETDAAGRSRSGAGASGGLLELEVRDNGVGLSAARLTDFNRGVGLANTRSRLQHLYGSSHRFEFRQPPAAACPC